MSVDRPEITRRSPELSRVARQRAIDIASGHAYEISLVGNTSVQFIRAPDANQTEDRAEIQLESIAVLLHLLLRGGSDRKERFLVRVEYFAGPSLSIVEKASEYPRPCRMLELAQRLRLDLADAFARHRELLADFFQCMVAVHADPEAHA
jgi:hypothetical protein